MMQLQATGVSHLAGVVTQVSIAVLSLVAVLVVVVGVFGLVRSRRREQVVIEDIRPVEFPVPDQTSHAPSLSPWLRQRVRFALSRQRSDAKHIVEEILGRDVKLGRMPVDVTMNYAEAAISGAADDALAAMSHGLRVLAPAQAEDLLGVLSAVLPRRRGYRVTTAPIARGSAGNPRLGLSVELAHLDGPPIATTTFWESTAVSVDPLEIQDRLVTLIEPAASWIAMRLLTMRLVIRPAGRARRRSPAALQLGVRQLFAGGLGRTAMGDFPTHATAFGEDAIDELTLAAESLDKYHRPSEMLASVWEELGRVRMRDGSKDEVHRYFVQALRHWRQAETILADNPGLEPGRASQHDALEDYRERLRLRLLKCQLLIGAPTARAQVIADLSEHPLSLPSTANMRTLYNAACLYATLGEDFLVLAEETIGRALLAEPSLNVRAIALNDDELRPIDGLEAFLDHVAGLRPVPPTPVRGAEAATLIAQARIQAVADAGDY